MYSTCLFCHSSLGKNEAVENFPIGRRLAFDSEKGRLWAVCAKCGRWNLTPIEERWEAIEECERQFRATILRSSTDEIGLGRVREGTDLIRVGKPLRPEFAAWRYGRHFEHRRRLTYVKGGVGIALTAAVFAAGGPVVGLAGPSIAVLERIFTRRGDIARAQKVFRQHAKSAFGKRTRDQNVGVRIIPSETPQGWALRFAHSGKFLDFQDFEAVHTAHLIAPILNIEGGNRDFVRIAVREIEVAGSPERFFLRVLKYGQSKGWRYTDLSQYPHEMRLAFEMASHEATERSALEEDLARLEADWREAEEIAQIADNLFVPHQVIALFEKLRGG